MNEVYTKSPSETFDDYFVRLFEHKTEYGLNCEAIADLLNEVGGTNYGESCFRKAWTAFNRGRTYERMAACADVKRRVLCLSDLHIPFQLPVETYSKYASQVDTLILNGDILDCQKLSKFLKRYYISPIDEILEARKYLMDLIDLICPKEVLVLVGNHEIRFRDYLSKTLDNELQELMPDTALDYIFTDGFYHYDKANRAKIWYDPLQVVYQDITFVHENSWFAQLGDTIFCHPLTYSSSMLKTTEKAVTYFRNTGHVFKNLVCAHTHKVGDYMMGDTWLIEQGCCCDTGKLDYADGKLTTPQKEGYCYLCLDKNDALLREKSIFERLN